MHPITHTTNRHLLSMVVGVTLLSLGLFACGGSQHDVDNGKNAHDSHHPSSPVIPASSPSTNLPNTGLPNASDWQWQLPANFPLPVVPNDNPMSVAKVELGRHLFYDKRLSGNATQSCVSCHQQDKAFTDGLPTAIGSTGEKHPRNSQTLVNVAYSPTLTWANPALTSLEKQMQSPIFGEHPIELGINDNNKADIVQRFAQDSRYQRLFANAFPDLANQPDKLFNFEHIVQAIASFERSIVSADSRYDRYLQGKAELTAQEVRGMNLFNGDKAECSHCHTSFNFTDQVRYAGQRQVDTPFHNTGLYNLDQKGSYPNGNGGVFELSGNYSDMGKFRTPSLRNIAVTAPYNHDGSTPTLEAVLQNYANGGRNLTTGQFVGDGRTNPNKDDLIVSINLSPSEQADIVAFLRTLTDETLLTNPRFADPFVH
ncbi:MULTISPECIES: MbnH family di-heme enzyme [unclassified Moraxella]|uniref:MbnH family di-heme enzyme n=1 Tax=unclassified Moraxella TaxID=2685852 RepID=UPI003AF7C83E